MSSIIIKFFGGILATLFAHRIISIIISISIAFLIYKYITDPKYISNLIKYIKDIIDSFGNRDSLFKTKDAKETLAFLF